MGHHSRYGGRESFARPGYNIHARDEVNSTSPRSGGISAAPRAHAGAINMSRLRRSVSHLSSDDSNLKIALLIAMRGAGAPGLRRLVFPTVSNQTQRSASS